MLKLFKQGIAVQLVVILMVVLALWASAFVHPVTLSIPTQYSPIFNLAFGWMERFPMLASGIALILVLGEGLMLNEMLYNKGMVSQNTLLPMFIYVVLMSYGVESHTITPALLVNLVMMITLRQLMQTGQPNLSVARLTNTALCVSIASMIYLPAAMLIVPLLTIMPIFKMYRWKDWMALLMGLANPYIIWALYGFMTDSLDVQWSKLCSAFTEIDLSIQASTMEYVCSAIMLAIAIIMLIGGLSKTGNHTTIYKNNVLVLELPMIASLLILPYCGIVPVKIAWFAIGITFAGATFFWDAKKRLWIYELMLLVLLAATFISTL